MHLLDGLSAATCCVFEKIRLAGSAGRTEDLTEGDSRCPYLEWLHIRRYNPFIRPRSGVNQAAVGLSTLHGLARPQSAAKGACLG